MENFVTPVPTIAADVIAGKKIKQRKQKRKNLPPSVRYENASNRIFNKKSRRPTPHADKVTQSLVKLKADAESQNRTVYDLASERLKPHLPFVRAKIESSGMSPSKNKNIADDALRFETVMQEYIADKQEEEVKNLYDSGATDEEVAELVISPDEALDNFISEQVDSFGGDYETFVSDVVAGAKVLAQGAKKIIDKKKQKKSETEQKKENKPNVATTTREVIRDVVQDIEDVKTRSKIKEYTPLIIVGGIFSALMIVLLTIIITKK